MGGAARTRRISKGADYRGAIRNFGPYLGDAAAELPGDRILGLTHHYLGNQVAVRDHAERVLRVVRGPGNALHTEFQLSPEIAATTILTRVLWLDGYPDELKTYCSRQ